MVFFHLSFLASGLPFSIWSILSRRIDRVYMAGHIMAAILWLAISAIHPRNIEMTIRRIMAFPEAEAAAS
jgi:hypothetical protein